MRIIDYIVNTVLNITKLILSLVFGILKLFFTSSFFLSVIFAIGISLGLASLVSKDASPDNFGAGLAAFFIILVGVPLITALLWYPIDLYILKYKTEKKEEADQPHSDFRFSIIPFIMAITIIVVIILGELTGTIIY